MKSWCLLAVVTTSCVSAALGVLLEGNETMSTISFSVDAKGSANAQENDYDYDDHRVGNERVSNAQTKGANRNKKGHGALLEKSQDLDEEATPLRTVALPVDVKGEVSVRKEDVESKTLNRRWFGFSTASTAIDFEGCGRALVEADSILGGSMPLPATDTIFPWTGLWWMKGNPAPEIISSAVGVKCDSLLLPTNCTVDIQTYSHPDTQDGLGNMENYAHSNIARAEIMNDSFILLHTDLDGMGVQFPSEKVDDDHWVRISTIPGVFKNKYDLVRVVNADGSPNMVWYPEFLKFMSSSHGGPMSSSHGGMRKMWVWTSQDPNVRGGLGCWPASVYSYYDYDYEYTNHKYYGTSADYAHEGMMGKSSYSLPVSSSYTYR